METDKNPMPRFDLFPRLARVGQFLGRLVSFNPTEAPDYMSNHYRGPRGASELLDSALYDQVDVHGFRYDGEDQLQIDFEEQSNQGW